MSDLLTKFAIEYAQKTGCDAAQATQASFVIATLLADIVGRKDIGNYFSKRASDMEGKGDGKSMMPFSEGTLSHPSNLIDTSNHNKDNWGWY